MSTQAIVINDEFAQEMFKLIGEFQQGGIKAVEGRAAAIMKKHKMPARAVRAGECSGCAACGACPIVHIKAGYLLAAFHLDS